MKIREFTLEVFSSPVEADEANRKKNRMMTGEERLRMLTAIVGGDHERPEPRLPGPYRVIHVPRS